MRRPGPASAFRIKSQTFALAEPSAAGNFPTVTEQEVIAVALQVWNGSQYVQASQKEIWEQAALAVAITFEDWPGVKRLILSGVDPNWEIDDDYRSLLHYSIPHDVARVALENGANPMKMMKHRLRPLEVCRDRHSAQILMYYGFSPFSKGDHSHYNWAVSKRAVKNYLDIIRFYQRLDLKRFLSSVPLDVSHHEIAAAIIVRNDVLQGGLDRHFPCSL